MLPGPATTGRYATESRRRRRMATFSSRSAPPRCARRNARGLDGSTTPTMNDGSPLLVVPLPDRCSAFWTFLARLDLVARPASPVTCPDRVEPAGAPPESAAPPGLALRRSRPTARVDRVSLPSILEPAGSATASRLLAGPRCDARSGRIGHCIRRWVKQLGRLRSRRSRTLSAIPARLHSQRGDSSLRNVPAARSTVARARGRHFVVDAQAAPSLWGPSP
jgi:hypothetical protein